MMSFDISFDNTGAHFLLLYSRMWMNRCKVHIDMCVTWWDRTKRRYNGIYAPKIRAYPTSPHKKSINHFLGIENRAFNHCANVRNFICLLRMVNVGTLEFTWRAHQIVYVDIRWMVDLINTYICCWAGAGWVNDIYLHNIIFRNVPVSLEDPPQSFTGGLGVLYSKTQPRSIT